MIVYKLTDENMRTHGGFQWTLGEKRTTNGKGELCGSGWLHAYLTPLLAVLLNPIHANFSKLRLFKAEADGKVKHDRGLKLGATKMTLLEEVPLPQVTTAQRVRFAQNCAEFAKQAANGPRMTAEEIAVALDNCAQEAVA